MPNFLSHLHKQAENNFTLNNLIIPNSRCKCFDLFHKNFMNNFSNQYFKLGYVLLICASGGLKFDSLSIFFEEYSNILKENKNNKICCLYHLVISFEEAVTPTSKTVSKLKISNFINSKIFSENFIDFLCKSLTLQPKANHNSAVVNHPWIKITNYIQMNNNFNKVRVCMKEVIKISREFKRCQLKQTNHNEAKFNNFFNNFEIILSNNKSIKREELSNAIDIKKDVIKDLTFELGINSKDLVTQLQAKVMQDFKVI